MNKLLTLTAMILFVLSAANLLALPQVGGGTTKLVDCGGSESGSGTYTTTAYICSETDPCLARGFYGSAQFNHDISDRYDCGTCPDGEGGTYQCEGSITTQPNPPYSNAQCTCTQTPVVCETPLGEDGWVYKIVCTGSVTWTYACADCNE